MDRRLLLAAALTSLACTAADPANDPAATANAPATAAPPAGATPAQDAASGSGTLSYAGLFVPEVFDSLAAQFPKSPRAGDYIYVDSTESRGGITAIGYVRSGDWSRISLVFEEKPGLVVPGPAANRYPRCAAVQDTIVAVHGLPDSLKRFAEESQVRFDRYWTRGREHMVLICFFDRDSLYAEAVTIERRTGG